MAPLDATEVPAGYDPKRMPPLSWVKVVFWDETHRKVEIGNVTSDGTVVVIPPDADGNPDPNGKVETDTEHELGVKYPGEVRFSLGVHYGGRCEQKSCHQAGRDRHCHGGGGAGRR